MKTTKRILSIVLVLMMLLSFVSLFAGAADEISVKLRVEGSAKNYYYGNVTVSAGATAYDVLKKAADEDDSLKVSATASQYGGVYVYQINDDVAGSIAPAYYDGWLFRVNGVEPSVGMNAYEVKNGDYMIAYYGDPYATGMQYPEYTYENGVLTFTSMDTTYDENGNPEVKKMAVVGATVTLSSKDNVTTLTTDENGQCKVTAPAGTYNVQIAKTDAETGCPLVLRFAPAEEVITVEAEKTPSVFEKIIASIRSLFDIIVNFFKSIFTK